MGEKGKTQYPGAKPTRTGLSVGWPHLNLIFLIVNFSHSAIVIKENNVTYKFIVIYCNLTNIVSFRTWTVAEINYVIF